MMTKKQMAHRRRFGGPKKQNTQSAIGNFFPEYTFDELLVKDIVTRFSVDCQDRFFVDKNRLWLSTRSHMAFLNLLDAAQVNILDLCHYGLTADGLGRLRAAYDEMIRNSTWHVPSYHLFPRVRLCQ